MELPDTKCDVPAQRYKLVIAYDGTQYAGWQIQPSGLAVQECVNIAMHKLFPGASILQGSSRTDAGVHARGMVAHVDIPKTEARMTGYKMVLALNAHLAEDIRVCKVTRAPSTFHARFNAKGKQYRYLIWNHSAMDPLLRTQAWHVTRKLNIQAMRDGARLFIGKKDFKSFAANHGYEIKSTIRTLTACRIQKSGPLISFVIEGDGFLYKMCRGIVGTLVQVGLGRFPAEQITEMLEKRDRRLSGMSAPAHGLILQKVFYS
jgi:tRNA pseudouridine38-40 synthase